MNIREIGGSAGKGEGVFRFQAVFSLLTFFTREKTLVLWRGGAKKMHA
jgi:hypothetical protein